MFLSIAFNIFRDLYMSDKNQILADIEELLKKYPDYETTPKVQANGNITIRLTEESVKRDERSKIMAAAFRKMMAEDVKKVPKGWVK